MRGGRQDIEAYWEQGLCQAAARVDITAVATFAAGTSIAAHWHMDAVSKDSYSASAEGIDVLTLDSTGLILRAEGYWDIGGFRNQLTGD